MMTTTSAVRRAAWTGAAAIALICAGARGADEEDAARPAARPSEAAAKPVDLAICLDTSGSMDGLIDAARQKLWSIVNDLALAKPAPKLRVALLTYGNDGHPAEVGWVRVDAGFTEDLDLVSQQLFALTTNGGTEYVGRVLQAASEQLSWSQDPNALKLVVVAGNESAEQDAVVDFRAVCKTLIERGVVVNSIYCGNPADGLAPAWQDVARCADGQFAAIDQQNGTVVIATPFDAELATLSAAINETYVGYGVGWQAAAENQVRQDANAASCNDAAAAARAATKASGLYKCSWDLVDAVKNGSVKLEEVKKEELPEKMRELPVAEQQKLVDAAWSKRQEIQKKIQEIGRKRAEHLDAEMKKQGTKDDQAFDRAVRDAVRKQAESKGFEFPKDAPMPVETTEEAAPADAARPAAPAPQQVPPQQQVPAQPQGKVEQQ